MSARGKKPAVKKGIAEGAQSVPNQPPVKVFGSYIWPEMRLVCNIFDTAHRNYRVESAGDIFTEAGQKDEASFNPSRAMPIVVVNDMKILADPCTLVKHLCRNFNMEQLYPIAPNASADREKIDQILEVCFLHFKRSSDRLVKMVI